MRPVSLLSVFLLVAALACGREGGVHPAPAAIASGQIPSSPTAPALNPCDALRRAEAIPPSDSGREDGSRDWFWCDPKGSGWATRYEPERQVDGGMVAAKVSIFHGGTSQASWVRLVEDRPIHDSIPARPVADTYDFDGDGLAELFVAWEYSAGVTDDFVVTRNLVTFKQGVIAPYAPADGLPVVGFVDSDGDGRQDLALVYELGKARGCDWQSDGYVPLRLELIAHSLSGGGFSLTDAVARSAFARRYHCPGPPGRAVVLTPATKPPQDPPAIDQDNLLCARITGTPKDVIARELEETCRPHSADTRKCRGPCRYLPSVQQYVAFEPPVTFVP
jgi:hypothetical protein